MMNMQMNEEDEEDEHCTCRNTHTQNNNGSHGRIKYVQAEVGHPTKSKYPLRLRCPAANAQIATGGEQVTSDA
jgi:hypothetical protein